MTDRSASIVAAVDAVGSAADAVAWAAAEASARGSALRIVHARSAPRALDPAILDTGDYLAAITSVAEEVVGKAAARARAVASDINVTTAILDGPAGWALEQAAHGASLLVLGSRGRKAVQRLLGGSVSGHLAARAPCPIVVVRGQTPPARGAAVVVAGVVPGASTTAAIEFAFRAAWQRRIPLRLVHVTPDGGPPQALTGLPSTGTSVAGWEAIPDPKIVEAIRHWHRALPAAEISIIGPTGDPADILLTESTGAALLVLASAGGKRLAARHVTSVGQRVLPKARCPVAVVGHAAADDARTHGLQRGRKATARSASLGD